MYTLRRGTTASHNRVDPEVKCVGGCGDLDKESGVGGKQLEIEQNIAVDCIDSFFTAVRNNQAIRDSIKPLLLSFVLYF